jgi:hypothetical protein
MNLIYFDFSVLKLFQNNCISFPAKLKSNCTQSEYFSVPKIFDRFYDIYFTQVDNKLYEALERHKLFGAYCEKYNHFLFWVLI